MLVLAKTLCASGSLCFLLYVSYIFLPSLTLFLFDRLQHGPRNLFASCQVKGMFHDKGYLAEKEVPSADVELVVGLIAQCITMMHLNPVYNT